MLTLAARNPYHARLKAGARDVKKPTRALCDAAVKDGCIPSKEIAMAGRWHRRARHCGPLCPPAPCHQEGVSYREHQFRRAL